MTYQEQLQEKVKQDILDMERDIEINTTKRDGYKKSMKEFDDKIDDSKSKTIEANKLLEIIGG